MKLRIKMNYKSGLICIIILIVILNKSIGQIPDSIKNYLDSSLIILQNNSLYSSKVDWDLTRKSVFEKAKDTKTKSACFESLKIAFINLNDKHAAYYAYDDQFRIEDKDLEVRYSDSIRQEWSKGPRIKVQMIDKIAYISIPFMGVGKQEDIDRMANELYDKIAQIVNKNPIGYIIDLRVNAGGNIRPMMAGLGMFFEDGIISYYIDRNGNAEDESSINSGEFLISGEIQAKIKNKIPNINKAKIAVLIGPGTASSGEGVAVNLKGRKNTRLFGERTAGRANSTNGFVFNNQMSYYLISTAYLGDKNKKVLPEYVDPHEFVEKNDSFNNLAGDNVVNAAVNWLKNK